MVVSRVVQSLWTTYNKYSGKAIHANVVTNYKTMKKAIQASYLHHLNNWKLWSSILHLWYFTAVFLQQISESHIPNTRYLSKIPLDNFQHRERCTTNWPDLLSRYLKGIAHNLNKSLHLQLLANHLRHAGHFSWLSWNCKWDANLITQIWMYSKSIIKADTKRGSESQTWIKLRRYCLLTPSPSSIK